MKKTLQIFDDYLQDSSLLLTEAQTLPFMALPNNPSMRVTVPSRFAATLKRKVAKLVGTAVRWERGCGNYRVITAREAENTGCATFVHSDFDMNVVAMIYLSREAECHGGTGFYRHKHTGLEGFHDLGAVARALQKLRLPSVRHLSQLIAQDARDASRWEQTDFVQMKHNRLIVYDGGIFHSHVLDFQRVKKGSKRLTFGCWGVAG